MRKSRPAELNKILNNKTHGSAELVKLLNRYFISICKNKIKIKQGISAARLKLGHFSAVNSYLNLLQKKLQTGRDILNFLQEYTSQQKESTDKIFNAMFPLLKNITRIITISRSGTVLEILKRRQRYRNNLKVVVCASGPKYEGRLTAIELAKNGNNVELITDTMMGIYVPKIDAAIIGADSVLKNKNVVNKTGSYNLALLCREYRKPFYVVTSKSKFSAKHKFRMKRETVNKIRIKKTKNLTVSNIYFEEVPKALITKIITD